MTHNRAKSGEHNFSLRFHNAEHVRWHGILTRRGFDFMVQGQQTIGLVYSCPAKDVVITLEESGENAPAEFYEYKVQLRKCFPDGRFEYFVPIEGEYYTKAEWLWLTDAVDSFAALDREIHLLFNVRPRVLKTISELKGEQTVSSKKVLAFSAENDNVAA